MSLVCLGQRLVISVESVSRDASRSAEVKLVSYHCTINYSFNVMYTMMRMVVILFADAYGQHIQHYHAMYYH